jgi:hypothetical protein
MYSNNHAKHCICAELKEAYLDELVKQDKGKYHQEHAEHCTQACRKETQE